MTLIVPLILLSPQCKISLSFVSLVPRSVAIWGQVVFATQETTPYDIAVVSLEEDLDGVPTPVPAEHFHEGKDKGYSPEVGSVVWARPQEGESVLTTLAMLHQVAAPFPGPQG